MDHPPSAASAARSSPPAAPGVEPDQHDTCVRCGRATPVGVSLCPADNPGRIKGPSTTQVHGTILVGVIAGFIVIALAARFTMAHAGPFAATVHGTATRSDGTIELRVRVANEGTTDAGTTCRVSTAGVPSSTDPTFLTGRIPAGGAVELTRSLPPPGDGPPYSAGRIAVRCG